MNYATRIGIAFCTVLLLATGGDVTAGSIPFVKTAGTSFTIDDKPFFVTGANDFYLPFASKSETLRTFDDLAALRANVLRVFLHPVIGSLDGSVPTTWDRKSTTPDTHDTYMLYWDNKTKRMAINDGPNGMQKVDFIVAEAKKRNIRLIITFLDFWNFTGGSQQMRAWYGSTDKDYFFFTDPRTRQDYKVWLDHVMQRQNPLTGLSYKNDPTIMAWELMNEGNAEPMAVRRAWVSEMSLFIKGRDRNHLVASGNANAKPVHLADDLAIKSVDFGTWHGYPRYFNISPAQFTDLIPRYCELAVDHQKPVLLEEFGYGRNHPDHPEIYKEWLDILAKTPNCAGWLVWQLVARLDSGEYPVDDHDQFDIRNDGSQVWKVLKNAIVKGRRREVNFSAQ